MTLCTYLTTDYSLPTYLKYQPSDALPTYLHTYLPVPPFLPPYKTSVSTYRYLPYIPTYSNSLPTYLPTYLHVPTCRPVYHWDIINTTVITSPPFFGGVSEWVIKDTTSWSSANN